MNPTRAELGAEVKRRFGEGKADLILECVGAQQTIEAAVSAARKGTDIVVVGVYGDKPVVDMGLVQDRELRLIGTLMYQEPDWRQAIALVDSGKVNLEPLVTDRYPFDRYLEAYRYIDANREKAMKVMITVEP